MTHPPDGYVPVANVEVTAVMPQSAGFRLQGVGADGADYLMGFRALGETNDEASAAVIAACQAAGGVECTADEVTNDDLCIVSVADDDNNVVSGGAGVTIEAARADALQRAAANNTPEGPNARVLISDCSWRE